MSTAPLPGCTPAPRGYLATTHVKVEMKKEGREKGVKRRDKNRGREKGEKKGKRREAGSTLPWILVNSFCYILGPNPNLAKKRIYNMSQALKGG